VDEPTDRAPATAPEGLTLFQIQVAKLYFSLPASNGFLLAGRAKASACGGLHRTYPRHLKRASTASSMAASR
jgi:hypothetical protein